MIVYLLRHGIAEESTPGMSDADRGLTNEGRRKLRQVLAHVADSGIKLDAIVSSPFKRAQQTAAIAQSCLKCKGEIEHSPALAPGGDVEGVWSLIREHGALESLLLVGHNPLFSYLAGYLLGAENMLVDFKKGAVMCLEFDSTGPKARGVLRWYLTARLAGSCE